MMSKSAGKTTQLTKPQNAKLVSSRSPGIANPSESEGSNIPAPSTESFLVVNVCPGATKEQIVEAVDEALKAIEIPFFQYTREKPPGMKTYALQSNSGSM